MTVKLNLTIDERIVAKSKRYAAKKKTTVSKMVQEFLRKKVEGDENKREKKSFKEKYSGILNGKLSDKRIKRIKEEYLKKTYGC